MNLGEARRLWAEERREYEARIIALRLVIQRMCACLQFHRDPDGLAARTLGYEALGDKGCMLLEEPERPPTLADSVHRLRLANPRIGNILERHGFNTIGDVTRTSRARLLLVNEIGPKAIAELERLIAQAGLYWPEDPEHVQAVDGRVRRYAPGGQNTSGVTCEGSM